MGIMTSHLVIRSRERLSQIERQGLYKRERLINGAQAGRIRVTSQNLERELVNLCANNYLGFGRSSRGDVNPRRLALASDVADVFLSTWPRKIFAP